MSNSSRVRIRNYKLEFLEYTRTPDGRARTAQFLLNHAVEPRFTEEEVAEIVNNQLPPKQKPWAPEQEQEEPVAVVKRKKKVAA